MSRFDYFVMFAEMRTGSNFLESNLNALPGASCHGEAFNPHFIGYPNRDEVLGVTKAERDADPAVLLDAVKAAAGIAGFRYFSDHDPRVLDAILADPRCAKIVLTRNPAESYVSRKIAAATGQWKLTNAQNLKSEVIRFDAAEFEAHLDQLQQFQLTILRALQESGQTAFYVDYEDIQDLAVMNGLAAWLGLKGRLEELDRTLKKQNPEPIADKVANFEAMEQALARLDRFNLSRTPNFEPRRGAMIPSFLAAARSPLICLPIRSGPEQALRDWLTALDGAAPQEGFTQKTLRQWKLSHPGHRSFTVLRHPLARAHAAFCDRILPTGPGTFTEIREALRRQFKIALPAGAPGDDWPDDAHAAAFTGFLGFLKANLGGQTGLRVDPCWASQLAVLQGMAGFALPDVVLREEDLETGLERLAADIGRTDAPPPAAVTDPHGGRLARILTPELEGLARDAYQRDYMAFGFGPWRP